VEGGSRRVGPQSPTAVTQQLHSCVCSPSYSEVKRRVAAFAHLPAVLQRLTASSGSVDSFSLPLSVAVSLRAARAESATISVQLMSENKVEGVTLFTLQVDPTDSVLDLKFLLASKVGVAAEHQRIYSRLPLTPARTLLHDTQLIGATGAIGAGAKPLRLMFEMPSGVAGHGAVHATRSTVLARPASMPNVRSMGDMFLSAVAANGKKNFLGTRSYTALPALDRGAYTWITYGEAGVRVGNLAAGLRQLGVVQKESVGIVSQNRAEWTITDMVCNVQGFVSVPLYDTLGPDAIQFIIKSVDDRERVDQPDCNLNLHACEKEKGATV
jgi:hypothetical protein